MIMIEIGHASIPNPPRQRDTLQRIDRGRVTGAAAAVCFQAEPRPGCQSRAKARWRREREREESVAAP